MASTILKLFSAIGDACDPNTANPDNSFLGLPKWYKYMQGSEDAFGKCIPTFDPNNPASIWSIALVAIEILLRLITIIAVGFVIYGGFQYMTSAGQPEKIKAAKDTIINALIGVAISVVAASVVSFIGNSIK